MIILKPVGLEEKLNAQVKNLVSILKGDDPMDVKIMMFEMQKAYLEDLLNSIQLNLTEKGD